MIQFKPGVLETPKGMRVAGVSAASVRASSIQALNAKHGVRRIKQLYKQVLEARPEWIHLADNFVLYVPEESDLDEIIKEYEKDPNVISVSRVSRVRAFDTVPNDTHYQNGNQYGLINIKAAAAWDRSTGDSDVLIAVLDTGINYNHEDFQGRVDLAKGFDFVNNDSNPVDDFGHGTSVSGVIGATTNNGKGVAGMDWQAQIIPIKVLDNQGRGDMDDILDGIVWAISQGADVINMSFGQYIPNSQLSARCQDAYDAGIVLVAAAGNGDTDQFTYPASYSTVMAVAAVDENDERSIWTGFDPETFKQQASNYGTWVDVAAPGTDIWSTYFSGGYSGTNRGTSLACPFVSGLAALIRAADPGFTNQQIMDKIIDTADNIDDLNPDFEGLLGSGRINAFRALEGAVARITSPESNAYVRGTVTIYGGAFGWNFSSYALEVLEGSLLVATIEASAASVESWGILGTWETAGYNGQYTLRLRVFTIGSNTQETQANIFVDNITPEASITSPSDGQAVEGEISFSGTAQDQYLDRYLLEYGPGDSPLSFETIKVGYASVDGGILGIWETAGLEGIYTAKLTVYDKVGDSAASSIRLNIQGTPPTKEATPQPSLPLTFALPNPFNRSASSETTFNYSLEGNFNTKIYLFDLGGNLIWQKSYSAGANGGKSGDNNVAWNGQNLFGESVPNGVYIYQVVTDKKVIAKGKIIVLN